MGASASRFQVPWIHPQNDTSPARSAGGGTVVASVWLGRDQKQRQDGRRRLLCGHSCTVTRAMSSTQEGFCFRLHVPAPSPDRGLAVRGAPLAAVLIPLSTCAQLFFGKAKQEGSFDLVPENAELAY